MTGSLRVINNRYYVVISYKNPVSGKWSTTNRATGLSCKNNKKRAKELIPIILDQNKYLEQLPTNSVTLKKSKTIDNKYTQDILSSNADTPIMIDSYIDYWLSRKTHLAQTTYEKYSYNANKLHTYWSNHNVSIQNLSSNDVDQFLQFLLLHGKENNKNGVKEPLAPRTVRDYRSILNNILNQAIIDGIVKINPVSSVPVNASKVGKEAKYLFLSSSEIDYVLDFVKMETPNLYPFFFIGIFLGLRRSEFLGLKWTSINFVDKNITIKSTVTRVKTVHENNCTKTASSYRTLAMSSEVEALFVKILKEQQDYKAFFKTSYKNTQGYIFTQPDGSLINPDRLSKQISSIMKKMGRPDITLHKLRHTCASLLIELNWNAKKVQYWLGHADVTTTLKIYTHYERHRQNLDAKEIDNIIKRILK